MGKIKGWYYNSVSSIKKKDGQQLLVWHTDKINKEFTKIGTSGLGVSSTGPKITVMVYGQINKNWFVQVSKHKGGHYEKKFETKEDAIKYAINYMKNHM